MMQNLVLYNQRIYDRETLFQWFLSQQKFCDCNNWDRGKHKERKKMVIQQHIQIAELPQPFETCVSVGQQEQWLKVGFAKTPLNGSSWMHPVFGGCVSHLPLVGLTTNLKTFWNWDLSDFIQAHVPIICLFACFFLYMHFSTAAGAWITFMGLIELGAIFDQLWHQSCRGQGVSYTQLQEQI